MNKIAGIGSNKHAAAALVAEDNPLIQKLMHRAHAAHYLLGSDELVPNEQQLLTCVGS
jgi:hypothetical protein